MAWLEVFLTHRGAPEIRVVVEAGLATPRGFAVDEVGIVLEDGCDGFRVLDAAGVRGVEVSGWIGSALLAVDEVAVDGDEDEIGSDETFGAI